MITNDLNAFQRGIELLANEGFVVLQILNDDPEGKDVFFVVYKFTECYFNTAQSIDFSTMEGINVTEFLTVNSAMYAERTSFLASFNKHLENAPVMRLEFSKGIRYMKWQLAGTKARH